MPDTNDREGATGGTGEGNDSPPAVFMEMKGRRAGEAHVAPMDKREALIAELPRLRRYARALLGDPQRADDLVQDSVERALSRLALFRAGTNMRSWLFTIMHNLHVNALRRGGRAPDVEPLGTGALEAAVAPGQGASLAVRDVGRALELLPAEQRQVLLLIGLEDMSYRDAAQVLGVPIGTVMSRLYSARKRLADALEDER